MRKECLIISILILFFLLNIFLTNPSTATCDCNQLSFTITTTNLVNRVKELIESERHIRINGLSDTEIEYLHEKSISEKWTYTINKNPATQYPLNYLCGLVEPEGWRDKARFDPCIPTRDLPSSFDWRNVNGTDFTTSIKNQGSCGSCWAFGTIGPLECNIKIKDGIEEDLSEQWLVNCNQDDWGCDGGWWAHDYHEWKNDSCNNSGAVLEIYCPYTASDDLCLCPYPHDYFINDWAYIGSGSGVPPVNSIKQAIYTYGPVSAAICVNNAFRAYDGGVFNGPSCTTINHGITLVGWNDSQGSDGVWILRNSWGTGWGEDGYMRIEYGVSQVGYGSCYVNYSGTPRIKINLPNDVPETILPGNSTNISVQILETNDFYVNGTGEIHYRSDNGSFVNSTLTHIENNLYEAHLPPPNCGEILEYYFSAEGNESGVVFEPVNAPNITYFSLVGELTNVFYDNFETNLGWIVQNDTNLTDGAWERGVPVGGGDRGDPPSDFNGSGSCYLTDNVDGDSDVDNGITWLISPTINLSGGLDAKIDFALWYTNNYGADPNNDLFKVYLSDNNGSDWILAKTIGPDTPSPHIWHNHSIILSDYFAPTYEFKIRFEVSDLNDGSVVEAGIDNFCVKILQCSDMMKIMELYPSWNFISLPFNTSIIKSNILVSINESEYTWDEAVNNNIVIDYIYQWNRSLQNYESMEILSPGYGYWSYSYKTCSLTYQGIVPFLNDNYFTGVKYGWNMIGCPDNITIEKQNITIYYNNTLFTWQEAVNTGIILEFIYGWNQTSQKYDQSDLFMPCQSYWMYSYKDCILIKPN